MSTSKRSIYSYCQSLLEEISSIHNGVDVLVEMSTLGLYLFLRNIPSCPFVSIHHGKQFLLQNSRNPIGKILRVLWNQNIRRPVVFQKGRIFSELLISHHSMTWKSWFSDKIRIILRVLLWVFHFLFHLAVSHSQVSEIFSKNWKRISESSVPIQTSLIGQSRGYFSWMQFSQFVKRVQHHTKEKVGNNSQILSFVFYPKKRNDSCSFSGGISLFRRSLSSIIKNIISSLLHIHRHFRLTMDFLVRSHSRKRIHSWKRLERKK